MHAHHDPAPGLNNFAELFFFYIKELAVPILLGFLISGILYEFIPTKIIEKHLGKKGVWPIFTSTFIGTLLPVCCFGSLPIAVTMQQKGARLGPVLAFLVATPATSLPALMATWKLLGPLFTVYIFFAVIFMGMLVGLLGNLIKMGAVPSEGAAEDCCHVDQQKEGGRKNFEEKFKGIFRYAFVTLPQDIGLELLLGVAVASLVMVFYPAQAFIKEYLSGAWGYVFSLGLGLATYVCSTANVPMADAFYRNGMAPGAAMIYLLVGPITSYGMIFAVAKKFGVKVLVFYLVSICVLSLILGIFFNILITGRIV